MSVATPPHVVLTRPRTSNVDVVLQCLRQNMRWTERLLDLLPVPLMLLEPGTARLLFANRAAARMHGAPLARGTCLVDCGGFRKPDDEGGGSLDGHQIAPVSRDGEVQGLRIVWQTVGEPLSLLADSELLPALDHHEAVVVLTLRDVTALVRQEDELRRTVRNRDEFLSAASHELRTPITVLRLQIDSLMSAGAAGLADSVWSIEDRTTRKLTTIRNQVGRLQELVDTLLDVSRMIEGRLLLQPEPIDLADVAAEAVDLLRATAERAGCEVRIDKQASVPGTWDRLRLGQVITNLLSNAIKFGGGRPIDVGVARVGARARLHVRDQGVGIAPEDQARIFGRFERAAPERRYPGLGLGLWITKQIVDACGGTLSVDSQPGRGSTFTIEVPCSP